MRIPLYTAYKYKKILRALLSDPTYPKGRSDAVLAHALGLTYLTDFAILCILRIGGRGFLMANKRHGWTLRGL